MPRITAQDPKTKEWVDVEDEIDVTTGKSLAREGLKQAGVPFRVTERLVHKKTKEAVDVPEEELNEALGTGEFDIEALAEAKGPGYEEAQVEKYGDVGVNEAAIRKLNPLFDETEGAIASPTGALKAGANYFGAKFDESDPDIKKYRAETEMQRARTERGEENFPVQSTMAGLAGGALIPGLGARSAVGKIAAGATEGAGYAMAEDESKTAYNTNTALGAGVGGLIPAVVEGVKAVGRGVKNYVAGKGGGAGEQYIDNTEKLVEDLGAEDRARGIQDDFKAEQQAAKVEIAPIKAELDERKAFTAKEQAQKDAEIEKYTREINERKQLATTIQNEAKNKEAKELAALEIEKIDLKNKLLTSVGEVKNERLVRISKLDEEIAEKTRAIQEKEIEADLNMKIFSEDKAKDASAQIASKIGEYDTIIKENGARREAVIENLKDTPVPEADKELYINLRKQLAALTKGDKSIEAENALKMLDRFLPVEDFGRIKQGDLYERLLAVKKDLYDATKSGQGFGYKNFNAKVIARYIDDAFKNVAEPKIRKYTVAMGDVFGKKEILETYGTKRVKILNEEDRARSILAPEPLKAERAMDVSKESMGRAGYFPTLTKEIKEFEDIQANEINKLKLDLTNKKLEQRMTRNAKVAESPEIAQTSDAIRKLEIKKNLLKKDTRDALLEVQKLDNRVKVLEGMVKSTRVRPPSMAKELAELNSKRKEIVSRIEALKLKANGEFLEEVKKMRNIQKLYSEPGIAEAATNDLVDVGSLALPGAVGRVGRGVLSRVTDPAKQIRGVNWVRKKFNNPALTASYRALTVGGRTLSRKAIEALSEQHNVDFRELEEAIREGEQSE